MNSSSAIKLAAPGAGLPWIELIVARVWFARFRRKHDRNEITALFTGECERILKLAASPTPAEAARPVLIKRLRGMEDSSRNWSVYMTLEHLRILNAAVADVVLNLAGDRIPLESASTAAVKPAPGIDANVVAAFRGACETILQTVSAVQDLRTEKCYAHPWFGPLDAAGWHAMAAFHMRLHRQQIESIIASLA